MLKAGDCIALTEEEAEAINAIRACPLVMAGWNVPATARNCGDQKESESLAAKLANSENAGHPIKHFYSLAMARRGFLLLSLRPELAGRVSEGEIGQSKALKLMATGAEPEQKISDNWSPIVARNGFLRELEVPETGSPSVIATLTTGVRVNLHEVDSRTTAERIIAEIERHATSASKSWGSYLSQQCAMAREAGKPFVIAVRWAVDDMDADYVYLAEAVGHVDTRLRLRQPTDDLMELLGLKLSLEPIT